MWMTEYIDEIKKQFRDSYRFVPREERCGVPVFREGQIPDGEYPMSIDGKFDKVKIVDGKIHCCRNGDENE